RTSATRVTPCARSSSMNSPIGRVEWPTVRTGIPSPTGSCADSDFLGLVQAHETVERGAAVGGVVVLEQESLDELAPGAARGERGEEFALEPFLRRLRAVGELAEHGTAMGSELFEVEYLFARALQGLEIAALAAPREAVDNDEFEAVGDSLQFFDHPSSVSPVAAFEGFYVPAD